MNADAGPAPARALVFDLDGTLVDSAADLQASMNRVLAARGLPALTLDEIRGMVGDGVPRLVQRALAAVGAADAAPDAAVAAFMADYLAAPAVRTQAYPGVAPTLRALAAAGWRLGVCTNKPRAASLAILEALGLHAYFGAVIGGDSTPARKPDPRPLRAALEALGAAPQAAVMVGDGLHDARAAAAAGAAFIGVGYGYGAAGLATLRPPPLVAHRFADLPERLQRLAETSAPRAR